MKLSLFKVLGAKADPKLKRNACNETLVKAVALQVPELEVFKDIVGKMQQNTNLGFGLIPNFGRMVLKIKIG